MPNVQELSGIGAAYAAGLGIGVYDEKVFNGLMRTEYAPCMEVERVEQKYAGWQQAVKTVCTK